ncbi:MAG: hypothetical protein US40_C0003G0052 [Candidatus Roizmanbacteria bacterium GW2011_GWC2_37_13]|uniref:Uncharacterized protein n=1 Tax=Candidatus Roizmanbacteria bacterium GW2011_GWC2_37_13 TaxID=1618486 RepID=A0A0G0GJA6_9BACT|nr:MAG: hypothetical protein US40_C0003G0052 [Candidatus Roizmanbacteria bacterium GW2011_GWC2_37_13]
MEHKINRYIKGHMMTMMIAVLTGFLILFLGEFLLYRKIMVLNQMVSEGLIQIKEVTNPSPLPTVAMMKK